MRVNIETFRHSPNNSTRQVNKTKLNVNVRLRIALNEQTLDFKCGFETQQIISPHIKNAVCLPTTHSGDWHHKVT